MTRSRDRRARFGLAAMSSTLALTAALVLPPGALAAEPDQARLPFTHLDVRSVALDGTFKPAMLAGSRSTRFILKLTGASVGRARADALRAGRDLSKAQRDRIRRDLSVRQDAVARQVRLLGGRVFERFTDAYNGVAVRVPRAAVGKLAAIPGVRAVYVDRSVSRDNVAGVQYIRANNAWADLGLTGAGVKVAVIDTGIDYYHANFGGSGDPADFDNDNGLTIGTPAFPNAKVVGGYDFAGDDYDDSSDDPAKNTPHPDPDPLDCNGHGSHTAGTAAGFGVLTNGDTFGGPYDATTYAANTFTIGPGVAPEATIYGYRVFGCEGSSSEAVIVAALDRAMTDNVDVVNMSLGSPFGRTDEPSAESSNTLAENGIVVVASAGNSGAGAYIHGSPAAASRALAVAAIDASSPTFPGATVGLSTGQSIVVQESNGPFQGDPGPALPAGPLGVAVLRTSYPNGPVSLGCDPAEYTGYPGGVAGKLVVTVRGTCARVARAIFGEQAGAAAVAMINTSTSFPPFEGKITSNPDTGEPFEVTIPFFGVRGLIGGGGDADKLIAADGGSATSFAPTSVVNTAYQVAASFTSGGPRNVDSAVKPDVIAPGVSVKSTAVGTGTEGSRMSGTSMAAPHTAGVAALVTEAHPAWSTEAIKAAIVDTANASSSKILSYNVRTAGTGVVDARRAVDTTAYATTADASGTLSFGYEPRGSAYAESLPLTLHNTSGSAITYNLAAATNGSQLGTSVAFSANPVTVPAGDSVTVDVTLSLSAAAVAALPPASSSIFGSVVSVRGAVVATPTTSGTGIYPLRVPYVLVPRGLSAVAASARSAYTRSGGISTASVPVANGGIHSGVADVYAWGIHDANDVSGAEDGMDVRDVGVQVQSKAFLCGTDTTGSCSATDDRSLVFAVNFYGQAANPAVSEIDIPIDIEADGRPDFYVVGVDFGAVTTGDFTGQYASMIFDADANLLDAWVAVAPMNGSTVLLPALASEIGLDPAVNSTRFRYAVGAFSIVPGGLVDLTSASTFRSHQPPVSTGQQVALAPGGSATLNVSVDVGKNGSAPQRGWLIVTLDDANGTAQADEVPIGKP
jgi:minor extracellular serine protease Vpr